MTALETTGCFHWRARDVVTVLVLLLATLLCNFDARAAEETPEVFVQLGHTSGVWAMAVSPDGRTIAGGDMNGVVKLWDALSRQETFSFTPAASSVTALVYARDGARLYAGFGNGWLGIYDLRAGRLVGAWQPIASGKEVRALAISPDGNLLAIGGYDEGIKIVSLDPSRTVIELKGIDQGVTSLAFTPDGKRLVAGDASALRVWNLDAAQPVLSIPVKDNVSALAVSADGRSVFAGFGVFMMRNKDHAVRIYDLATGKETGSLAGHSGSVNSLALSPDGKYIAAATGRTLEAMAQSLLRPVLDDTVYVWDIAERKLVHQLRGHDMYVVAVAWRADGRALYSASWDKTLRTWSLPAGEASVFAGKGEVPALVVEGSEPGTLSMIDQGGGIMMLDLDSGQADFRPAARSRFPMSASAVVANAGRLDVLVLDNLNTVVDENFVGEHMRWLRRLPDGTTLHAELATDKEWAGAELTARLRAEAGPEGRGLVISKFSAAALSKTGERAYIGVTFFTRITRFRSRIVVWNRASGTVERVLPFDVAGEITGIAVSPDETIVLIGLKERTGDDLSAPIQYSAEARNVNGTLLWQETQKPQGTFGRSIEALAISPDSSMALIGNLFTAQLVDLRERRVRREFAGHRKVVTAVGFSPDGKLAASGSADGAVIVWDINAGRQAISLFAHSGSTSTITFTRDMKFLASASDDQTLRVWRWPTGELLTVTSGFRGGDWVTLTPDGYFAGSPAGAEQLGFRYEGRLHPLNQLYDMFYRPDLVRRKLRGEDLRGFAPLLLGEALKSPPPEVRVEPVADSAAGRVRVSYSIDSAGGGIGEIRVFHNGKLVRSDGEYPVKRSESTASLKEFTPAAVTRGLAAFAAQSQGERSAPALTRPDRVGESIEIVPVPGDNEISVTAFNRNNTVQSRIHATRFNSSRVAEPPRVFVLAIGIDRFRGKPEDSALAYAVKDAQDMAALMRDYAKRMGAGELQPVRVLDNERATRAGIMEAFADLARNTRPQDTLIVFIATHGVFDGGTYALVTHDYDGTLGPASTINAGEIIDISKRIPAQRQLLILDTCHSGGLDGTLAGLYDARMSLIARNVGLHTFASAGTLQEALDGFEGNGLFTHVLLQGLRAGEADANKDRTVTVFELGDYARQTVPGLARKVGHRQTPLIMKFGRDLPLMTGY